MSAHQLQVGQLVTSSAGRDKGKPFFVIRIVDDRFIDVADGDLRSIDKPKRKNVRHVKPHRIVHEELARLLRANERPTDDMLRRLLASTIAAALDGEGSEEGRQSADE